MLSLLLFATIVNVITEYAKEGLMNEILYADELVLTSESAENVRKVLKWKNAFESMGLKVNLKTKVVFPHLPLGAIFSRSISSPHFRTALQRMKYYGRKLLQVASAEREQWQIQ